MATPNNNTLIIKTPFLKFKSKISASCNKNVCMFDLYGPLEHNLCPLVHDQNIVSFKRVVVFKITTVYCLNINFLKTLSNIHCSPYN